MDRDVRRLTFAALAAALMPVLLTGCQGGLRPLATWRMAHDKVLAPPPAADEGENASAAKLPNDDRLLMKRWLNNRSDDDKIGAGSRWEKLVTGIGFRAPRSEADRIASADEELTQAEQLFQQGDLPTAEKEFTRIARNRKHTSWGEKAQYYLAEIQYQRGKLVSADNSLQVLASTYPGTKYLEKLVHREYAIADTWLSTVAEPAADTNDPTARTDEKPAIAWYDRFTGKVPLVDTSGNALAVLEHVRHHDPKGPLADKAVMRIADHHYSKRDYETAAFYYDQLITDHPKSPLLHRAELASIDSKMKGYVGPDYDGQGLDQARELIRQTTATFPESIDGNKDLYHRLDLINDQDAERAYRVAAYYKKIGKVASAEYYYGMVLNKWPRSDWADKSRQEMAVLAKMPRTQSLPSKIMTQPGSNDPILNGTPGAGGMFNGGGGGGGGGMPMGGMGGPGMGF